MERRLVPGGRQGWGPGQPTVVRLCCLCHYVGGYQDPGHGAPRAPAADARCPPRPSDGPRHSKWVTCHALCHSGAGRLDHERQERDESVMLSNILHSRCQPGACIMAEFRLPSCRSGTIGPFYRCNELRCHTERDESHERRVLFSCFFALFRGLRGPNDCPGTRHTPSDPPAAPPRRKGWRSGVRRNPMHRSRAGSCGCLFPSHLPRKPRAGSFREGRRKPAEEAREAPVAQGAQQPQ
jgi:hypothetical protein